MSKNGELFRIPTLVPAVKPDGSCIHFTAEERCGIHENAPYGCAYADCKASMEISRPGLVAVVNAHRTGDLYSLIWHHLHGIGRRQRAPEELI